MKYYYLGDFRFGITYDESNGNGVISVAINPIESSILAAFDHSFESIENVKFKFNDDIQLGGELYVRVTDTESLFDIETKVGVSNRQAATELYTFLKDMGATDLSKS